MPESPLGDDFVSLIGQSRINQLGRRFINGRPLSMETRYRIVDLHNQGVKPCKISRELQVSHGAVSKILNRYAETGSVEPGKIGGNTRCRLAIQSVRGRLADLIRRRPAASAAELCAALVDTGVCTPENVPTPCSINRFMRSRGMKRRSRPMLGAEVCRAGSDGTALCNDTWMLDWGGTVTSSSATSSSAGENLSPPSDAFGVSSTRIIENDNDNDSENENDVDIQSVSDGESDLRIREELRAREKLKILEADVSIPNPNKAPSPPPRSGLNYGINAILGSSSHSNMSLPPKKPSKTLCSTPASISASDEENWPSGSSSLAEPQAGPSILSGDSFRPRTMSESRHLSGIESEALSEPRAGTVLGAESCQLNHLSRKRCTDPSATGSPLDAFTKHAESTGGVAEYRRSRTCFTAGQLQAMERSFDMNNYPNETERQRLMYLTGLDDDKIITWFSNRRARKRKSYIRNLPSHVVRALEERYGPLPADPGQLNSYVKTVWREAAKLPQEQQQQSNPSAITPTTTTTKTTTETTQLNPCQFEFLISQLIQQQHQQQQQQQNTLAAQFVALAQQQFLSQFQRQFLLQQQQQNNNPSFPLLQHKQQQQQLSVEQQKLLFSHLFGQAQQQQQLGLPYVGPLPYPSLQ